jgi:phage tail P2-like protein
MDSLLPLNRSPLEIAIEQALTSEQINTHNHIQMMQRIGSPLLAPVDLLPWLAWTVSVDYWQSELTEAVKREVIAQSKTLHAHKGSVLAVKKAIESAGYGANSEIVEGAEVRHYDGTLFADGSAYFEGESWAKYSINVDLGENKGISVGVSANARSIIERAAPARCHLTDICWKSDIADTVAVNEITAINLSISQEDITPWQIRYDGSTQYNQGTLLSFNGAKTYNGAWDYITNNGSSALSQQQDNELTTHITLSLDDKQSVLVYYDGSIMADGTYKESDSLFAEDDPMQITVTTHLAHNGKKTYGSTGKFFNGNIAANGANNYAWNQHYVGSTQHSLTVN